MAVLGVFGRKDPGDKRLRELYAQQDPPLSCLSIAAILSTEFRETVTRSAVSGRISRLKLTREKQPAGNRYGKVIRRAPLPKKVRTAPLPSRSVPIRKTRVVLTKAPQLPQTKAEMRREFEEAWANTASLPVD